jgi:hypothetical protein
MSIITLTKNLDGYSFSPLIVGYFEEMRPDENLEKASTIKKILVYTFCEVGFLCATLIGIIETVFWIAVAIVCKLPQALLKTDRAYAQIIFNLNASMTGVAMGAVMLVINYFETRDMIKDTLNEVSGAIDKVFEKYDNIFSYHLFTNQ